MGGPTSLEVAPCQLFSANIPAQAHPGVHNTLQRWGANFRVGPSLPDENTLLTWHSASESELYRLVLW